MPNKKSKKRWWIGGGVTLVIVLIITLWASRGGRGGEVVLVAKRDLVESVVIAGRVEARAVASLGFDVSGRVSAVPVSENQDVVAGQTLMTLDLGTLPAELKTAQANLSIKRAESQNTSTNLEAVTHEQDTLVANARSVLLSDGLVAKPQDDNNTLTPPTITGRYSGPEGRYKVIIKRGEQSIDSPELRTFGLEQAPAIDVVETGATRLGTRGLFISFPDLAEQYEETIWYVDVPNTTSSVYLANYNAYQAAVRARDQALAEAAADVRRQEQGYSVASAEVAAAEAEVERLQAEIGKRTLRAPFSGLVSAVDVEAGEAVSVNQHVMTVLTDSDLGVEIDLPEADVTRVVVGDAATITLDAVAGKLSLAGTVTRVNRSETIVDGVPVYEARVSFTTPDPRVVSGLTAEVTIVTDKHEQALAVPARALKTVDGATVVAAQRAGQSGNVPVATGLRSSDGYVEILSGLTEGEAVLVPAAAQ